MIRRRAAAAGIATKLGNHSFSGDRNNGAFEKRGRAGKSRGDGEPWLDVDDAAL
jgi:hypothetical protein